MDFITRDSLLIAAMNAWVLHKERPLGALLEEQRRGRRLRDPRRLSLS